MNDKCIDNSGSPPGFSSPEVSSKNDVNIEFASLSDELKNREAELSSKLKDLRQLETKLKKKEDELRLKEAKIKEYENKSCRQTA